MSQPFGQNITEIDLGEHTLILLPNNSMELCAQPGDGVDLDSEETYRLYLSLQARFQPILLAEQKEATQWDW